MSEHKIFISPEGVARFIYHDELIPLLIQGKAVTKRASHVEPEGDRWFADLSPVGGPRLGPYLFREDALIRERNWLIEHQIPLPV